MRTIWLIFPLILNSAQLGAQEHATLIGRVIDIETRQPLQSAIVSISTLQRAITDQDGLFRIDSVAAGRHELVVRRIGYKSERFERTVAGGQTDSLTLALLYTSKGEEHTWCADGTEPRRAPIGTPLTAPGIRVSLRDAMSYAIITEDVHAVARDADRIDTLHLDRTSRRVPTYAGVLRTGEYLVSIRVPGYEPVTDLPTTAVAGCNITIPSWHDIYLVSRRP
jgi:hypothetical protein